MEGKAKRPLLLRNGQQIFSPIQTFEFRERAGFCGFNGSEESTVVESTVVEVGTTFVRNLSDLMDDFWVALVLIIKNRDGKRRFRGGCGRCGGSKLGF